MAQSFFSNNTTIKHDSSWLDLNTNSFVQNGNTTTAPVIGPLSGSMESTLNGTTTATITGATTQLFLQFTFDGGTNWYDVMTYTGTTGTAYTYTFTNFILGPNAGFRWRKASGIPTATSSTNVMHSRRINSP